MEVFGKMTSETKSNLLEHAVSVRVNRTMAYVIGNLEADIFYLRNSENFVFADSEIAGDPSVASIFGARRSDFGRSPV